jgi:hypothetical protein
MVQSSCMIDEAVLRLVARRSAMSRRGLTGCTVAILLLLVPTPALANIGPRWWGDRTAEPLGLKGVAITREDLDIHMRPLADLQPVKFHVTYRLHNSGPARRLDLLFVSGSPGVEDFEVRLDRRRVKSRPLSEEELATHGKELPKSWRPSLDVSYHRQPPEVVLVAFSVELPSGVSTLSSRYRARACGSDWRRPTATWLVPYILAPAREWQSFGELHVTAHLPDDWKSWSNPELKRDGSVLRGRFTGLPADALVLATWAPVPSELQRAKNLYGGLYALAVLGGAVVCLLAGRWLGRLLARWLGQRVGLASLLALPLAALLAVLWAAAIFGAWRLGVREIFATLRGQESPYFHEPFILWAFGTLLLVVLVLPVGFLLVLMPAYLAVKRAAHTDRAT